MKNQETYQKSRAYKRIESYYNAASRNNMISQIIIDLMLVILPIIAMVYLLNIIDEFPNRGHAMIWLFAVTIFVNFLSHIVAIKAHWFEMQWAEDQMGELNGNSDNKNKDIGIWDKGITVLNYLSWIMFIFSFVIFFIVIL